MLPTTNYPAVHHSLLQAEFFKHPHVVQPPWFNLPPLPVMISARSKQLCIFIVQHDPLLSQFIGRIVSAGVLFKDMFAIAYYVVTREPIFNLQTLIAVSGKVSRGGLDNPALTNIYEKEDGEILYQFFLEVMLTAFYDIIHHLHCNQALNALTFMYLVDVKPSKLVVRFGEK